MITSLKEFEEFRRKETESSPITSERTFPYSVVTTEERDALAAAIPGLPASYLECAEQVALYRVYSGYFSLWPEGAGSNLAESLIEVFSESHPFFGRLLAQSGLLRIGSWDADPLLISLKGGSEAEGAIVKFNSGNPDSQGEVLSPDFKTFLLVAGNLREVSRESDGLEAFQAFQERFKEIPSAEPYWKAWRDIAGVVTDYWDSSW